MKVYKIENNKIGSYMAKQGLIHVRDMVFSVLILISIFAIISGFKFPIELLVKVLPWIIILLIVVFFFAFLTFGIHQAKRFIITDDSFNQIQADENVDVVSKFFQKRAESKTGQSRNQFIPFSQVAKIKISNNSIKIKAKNYNFMNANGMIIIPCEAENYQEIVELTQSIIKNNQNIEFVNKQK